MPRVLVLLTLLLLGLAGSAPLLSPVADACTQGCADPGCADDDERGQCAPDCTDCACCVQQPAPLVAQASTGLSRVDVVRPRTEPPASRARAGVGRKVLHVPIRRDS